MMDASRLAKGTRIGKYRILEPLGEGAFAVVYRALDTRLQRDAALKVLRPERLPNPALQKEFLREARIIARLAHPHIVRIWDVLQEGGLFVVAMEYLPEGNLRQWASRTRPDVATLLRLLAQVAQALDYVHQQTYPDEHRPLLHRDVKPENVLIDRVPGTDTVLAKLSDFGLSLQPEWLQQLGIPGTVYYLAPEIIQNLPPERIDGRADQYALAVMAYEMLCGQRPFEGRDPIAIMRKHLEEPPPRPSEVNPALPAALDAPLLRALSKRPQERFPSCTAFVRALEEAWEHSVRERLQEVYAALERGEVDQAQDRLRQIHVWAPRHPLVLRAQQYIHLVRLWDAARQSAQEALRAWPRYPDGERVFALMGLKRPWRLTPRAVVAQVLFGLVLALPLVLCSVAMAAAWVLLQAASG